MTNSTSSRHEFYLNVQGFICWPGIDIGVAILSLAVYGKSALSSNEVLRDGRTYCGNGDSLVCELREVHA